MNRFLLVAGVALLAACGSDSPTGPSNPNSASIAGTYQMRTVSGSPLPFTYQSGTTKVVITSDVLVVADGGTWSETGAFTASVNGQTSNQVISDGGTWTRAGSAVSFYSSQQGATSYAGTFTGSGFSLADDLFTYTFAK